MNKKIIQIFAFIIMLIMALPVFSFAAKDIAKNFYIKKNGHVRPELPDDEKIIENYDAIFIDDNKCEKKIYLTFDAGYENGNVSRVLDVLKEEKVHGAFFLLGHIIKKNTDLIKRMNEEGHLVCNHTVNHKDMTNCSKDEMRENLEKLEKIYFDYTGNQMEKIFRFPEGRYDEERLLYAKDLGYKTVFWSLAYADWDNENQPDPEKAKKILLDNTHNGAIILLHPTSETNANILRDLIREWKKQGYEFGNLKDLF